MRAQPARADQLLPVFPPVEPDVVAEREDPHLPVHLSSRFMERPVGHAIDRLSGEGPGRRPSASESGHEPGQCLAPLPDERHVGVPFADMATRAARQRPVREVDEGMQGIGRSRCVLGSEPSHLEGIGVKPDLRPVGARLPDMAYDLGRRVPAPVVDHVDLVEGREDRPQAGLDLGFLVLRPHEGARPRRPTAAREDKEELRVPFAVSELHLGGAKRGRHELRFGRRVAATHPIRSASRCQPRQGSYRPGCVAAPRSVRICSLGKTVDLRADRIGSWPVPES